MDPITKLNQKARELLNQAEQNGPLDVATTAAKMLGVSSLSGIKGLSQLYRGPDAAAQAMRDYQAKYDPDQLNAAGIDTIRSIAPALAAAKASPLGRALHGITSAYSSGVGSAADLAGRYLGPTAAGLVGAAGEAAPMAITPEGLLGKGAEAAVGLRDAAAAAPYVKAALEKAPISGTDPIESAFHQRLLSDPEGAIRQYYAHPDTEGGRILSADTVRELSPDYIADRTLSSNVHEPASAFTKGLYQAHLAQDPLPGESALVKFTAGGTGAGKTSGSAIKAGDVTPQIIYDTNMNNGQSSMNKILDAIQAGKSAHVSYTYRDPVDALVNGALPRAMRQEAKFGTGRTVPVDTHLETHIGSNQTIPWLVDHLSEHPDVSFSAIDNSYGRGNAKVLPLDQIPNLEGTQDALRQQLHTALDEHLAQGKISPSVYAGFKADPAAAAAVREGRPGGDPAAAQSALQGPVREPILPDGSTARTIMHEGESARRAAPPSYTKSMISASELDPSLARPDFSPPDGAVSWVAADPQTGQHVAHVTAVPSGGVMRSLRMDTLPGWRGHGIAGDLLSDAVSHAHGQGMPYVSDTQVSVPAARVYEKLTGVHLNRHPDVSVTEDALDGPSGRSEGGTPIYQIDPAAPADAAPLDEPNDAHASGYIRNQAYAEGGEVGTLLSPLEEMIAKYASAEEHIARTGGITMDPATGAAKSRGYAFSVHKGREVKMQGAPTATNLATYAHANRDVLGRDPGAHIGVWEDPPKSGQHYLDVSHVEPDFVSAMRKAQANDQLGIYDLSNGQTIPATPDTMHFLHMGNPTDNEVTLDPKFMGSGIKGAEARRGGPKVTSLYPWDIDPSMIEDGLRDKTAYRVSVPASKMYDVNADPLNLVDAARTPAGGVDMSDLESLIKGEGYSGYHTPAADGLMRGQGRLFEPTPATRLDPQSDVQRFAEGGEVGALASPIEEMIAKYATDVGAPSHADTLANLVKENGGVTFNPTTGDIHHSGYAVPTNLARSEPLDFQPEAGDIHDYITRHQGAFDADPDAALHIHSDASGNHYLHVAHIDPDFESALAKARAGNLSTVNEIHTGVNHDVPPGDAGQLPVGVGTDLGPDPNDVEGYYASKKAMPPRNMPAQLDTEMNARPSTRWTPGKPTVSPALRTAFPGIYNDPRNVIADASAMVGPEDPLLRQLFGVGRQDLSDIAMSRTGNDLGLLPGATKNPKGSKAASAVMTPANEQRLIDVMSEARGTPLHTGMTGWYAMDPLYQHFVQMYGPEEAAARYAKFNTLMGMASPGSDVGTEIARGTAAHWLSNQDRFSDFIKYGGGVKNTRRATPADMADIPGHPYHRTAQGIPMRNYLESGTMQMKSPKVPTYINASGVPDTGFQTDLPIGDAHWARGVGLADTREMRTSKGVPKLPAASVSTPEMQALAPWWRDRVASQAGLQSVPAQALTWGAFAPYTGVESTIGAPKLEILATKIGQMASRLGVSPETARDLLISGKAGAF